MIICNFEGFGPGALADRAPPPALLPHSSRAELSGPRIGVTWGHHDSGLIDATTRKIKRGAKRKSA